jgi:hypothetical protein
MKAVSVPGFNAQQQIECALEGGLICHRLGLWRKYAFFLFIAALMSADNDNYGVAQALVSEFIFCCITLLVSFLTFVGAPFCCFGSCVMRAMNAVSVRNLMG